MSIDNIVIVSGYWKVPNKHSHQKYDQWFHNSLKINQLMYFFCENQETEDYIKPFRGDLPTIYIHYPMSQFKSNEYYQPHWVNPVHVPSVELGKIWHEKIHLMKYVKDNYPTVEFYIWCDAGACVYRDRPPPAVRLNLKNVDTLPHNQFCYSDPLNMNSYHNFSGTVYIIHRNMIDRFHQLFLDYVDVCHETYNDWRCGSDQVVFTEMMKDRPELFFKLAEGYGANLSALYDSHV